MILKKRCKVIWICTALIEFRCTFKLTKSVQVSKQWKNFHKFSITSVSRSFHSSIIWWKSGPICAFYPQDKPEAPQNKTSENKNRKSEIVDPFEYVRNMGTGASMEPIRSKTASNLKSTGHSDALILWKNSQSTSLNTLAKKKSSIPQPGKKIRMKRTACER